jgi:hypothetical protein
MNRATIGVTVHAPVLPHATVIGDAVGYTTRYDPALLTEVAGQLPRQRPMRCRWRDLGLLNPVGRPRPPPQEVRLNRWHENSKAVFPPTNPAHVPASSPRWRAMQRTLKVARAQPTVDCSCQALSARAFRLRRGFGGQVGASAPGQPRSGFRRLRPMQDRDDLLFLRQASHRLFPAAANPGRRPGSESCGSRSRGACPEPCFRLRLWLRRDTSHWFSGHFTVSAIAGASVFAFPLRQGFAGQVGCALTRRSATAERRQRRPPSSHARKRRANRCPCTARTYSISHAHPPSRETPTACQVARRFTEAHFRGDPQQIGRDVGSALGREAAQKQLPDPSQQPPLRRREPRPVGPHAEGTQPEAGCYEDLFITSRLSLRATRLAAAYRLRRSCHRPRGHVALPRFACPAGRSRHPAAS